MDKRLCKETVVEVAVVDELKRGWNTRGRTQLIRAPERVETSRANLQHSWQRCRFHRVHKPALVLVEFLVHTYDS